MNEQGQVVGTYGGHALLWADGKRTDLGTLKPEEDDGHDTRAESYGINNQGTIVGTSGSFGPATFGGWLALARGFIVQNNAPMRQWTNNRISFTPCAVNDAGEIVGMDSLRGFVYSGGKFMDLKTLSTRPAATAAQREGSASWGWWSAGPQSTAGFGTRRPAASSDCSRFMRFCGGPARSRPRKRRTDARPRHPAGLRRLVCLRDQPPGRGGRLRH